MRGRGRRAFFRRRFPRLLRRRFPLLVPQRAAAAFGFSTRRFPTRCFATLRLTAPATLSPPGVATTFASAATTAARALLPEAIQRFLHRLRRLQRLFTFERDRPELELSALQVRGDQAHGQ